MKFNMNKIQVGMMIQCNYSGGRYRVRSIIPYDRSQHGQHSEPDGSSPTHVIITDGPAYSNGGFYLGNDWTGYSDRPHIEMPKRPMYKIVVRAESETFELDRLVENESEGETYAKDHGFEFLCLGTTVQVPA